MSVSMRRCIVDRGLMEENTRAVCAAAGSAAVYGVLKAEGYGLGLEPMARTLAAQGIDRFAVTEPAAALRLLGLGLPAAEVLLLRPVPAGELGELLRARDVTFSIGSPEEAAALVRAGKRLGIRPRVQVQVDTGLSRYGFRWDEPARLRLLYEGYDALHFAGIYTHFSGSERLDRRQFARFQQVLASLDAAGIAPGRRHCCASETLFRHPEWRLDAVRVGSALLGRIPGGEEFSLRDVCRCEATVTAVRQLRPGDTAGYGGCFRARRAMRAAVVDMGALHGLGASAACGEQGLWPGAKELLRRGGRLLRGGALTARLGGEQVPVLGRLYSECAVLDATGIDCVPGDRAEFSVNPLYLRDTEMVWLAPEAAEAGPAQPVA